MYCLGIVIFDRTIDPFFFGKFMQGKLDRVEKVELRERERMGRKIIGS